MGDSTGKGNVMTVELAIQRELEYRQKVKMFGLKPFGASGWTEFLPLQVPVSSSSLSPTEPATKSNKLQNRMPDPSPVPAQTTSKKATLSSTSTRCPAPLPAKRKAETSNVESHMDRYFCSICQVPCSGASNYKMHIRGRQHAAKLENGRADYRYGQRSVNMTSHRCEICKISCTDEKALRMHFEGHKHLTKLQKLESNEECGAEEANVRKWCGLCKIWCMNESLFKQHLQGKKHTSNVRFGL